MNGGRVADESGGSVMGDAGRVDGKGKSSVKKCQKNV